MKRVLRILALLLALATLTLWLLSGANRGWTKTSVPVTEIDEVTGIESVNYQSRFVPGVDFVALALLGTGLLAGASFLFNRTRITTQTTNSTT